MEREDRLIMAAIRGWQTEITSVGRWFESRSAEQMLLVAAPEKNRAIYIFGHLLVAHDIMHYLLGLGARQYEFLDPVFLAVPDRQAPTYPRADELRSYWEELHIRLNEGIKALTAEQWAGPHLAVSAPEFRERPWLNRYSVLLNRTAHLSYHLGQLRLIAF